MSSKPVDPWFEYGVPQAQPDWRGCPTPDCGNRICLWSGLGVCFPCGERIVGRAEMIRRYDTTHDRPWAEVVEESDDAPPNYWNGNVAGEGPGHGRG